VFMIFFLACFAAYPARGTLVNYFIAGYRIFGRALWNYIYSNANDLAALTFFPLSLCVAVALTEKSIWPKRAAIAGTIVLPLIMLLTQSRGALIGLVATGLVFFVAHTKGRRARSLLTAAAAAVVVVPFVPRSAWERFSLMKNLTSTTALVEADPEGSAEARYNIWRVAGTIIKENPVAGIGLGVYPLAHAMYAPRVGVPVSALGFRDTHSTYLNVAAETGIPGAILFLTMVAVVAVPADQMRRRARGTPRAHQLLALELGLLGFMLAGIFGSFAKLSFLYIQLAVMWAVTDITKRELAAASTVPIRGSGLSLGGRTRRAG
jgi:O-antigen ligase